MFVLLARAFANTYAKVLHALLEKLKTLMEALAPNKNSVGVENRFYYVPPLQWGFQTVGSCTILLNHRSVRKTKHIVLSRFLAVVWKEGSLECVAQVSVHSTPPLNVGIGGLCDPGLAIPSVVCRVSCLVVGLNGSQNSMPHYSIEMRREVQPDGKWESQKKSVQTSPADRKVAVAFAAQANMYRC